MELPYRNRHEAGKVLGEFLAEYGGQADVIVLALPRGGVPVAFEVARRLEAPLDLMLVRKLGVPGHEELAMGALATGGARVTNPEVVRSLGISDDVLDAVTDRERAELQRRERAYRGDRPPPEVTGRQVLVVDDGLATGASMRVAVAALRQQNPARLVVAVPVAPPDTVRQFQHEGVEVVCPATPEAFAGVGKWYVDFDQTSDEEVRELLAQAWAQP